MVVYWEVEDGYVGGSRPQQTEIDKNELMDLPESERQQYIEDCVQEDFEQKVSWAIINIEE